MFNFNFWRQKVSKSDISKVAQQLIEKQSYSVNTPLCMNSLISELTVKESRLLFQLRNWISFFFAEH